VIEEHHKVDATRLGRTIDQGETI